MFGLSIEKLLLVAIIAAALIGPTRLPIYAAHLGAFVRGARRYAAEATARVEAEVGSPLAANAPWRGIDPHAYDPRRIVRDAMHDERDAAVHSRTEAPSSAPPR